MSEHAVVAKTTEQTAEQRGVLVKLLIFAISLAVVPISSYFLSKSLWDGNNVYAAITAIVAANAVLVAYIIASILEENAAAPKPAAEMKKTQWLQSSYTLVLPFVTPPFGFHNNFGVNVEF
ncbi:hypothetical protein K474DRAFT_1773917 [Panus rudis PR-1116 ss-1]|nr:hypothetical protein K474DRAFT_1773917 [Panus rudis PR-1116 ss-1]